MVAYAEKTVLLYIPKFKTVLSAAYVDTTSGLWWAQQYPFVSFERFSSRTVRNLGVMSIARTSCELLTMQL